MNAQSTRESFFQTLFPLPKPVLPGEQVTRQADTVIAERAGIAYDPRLYVPRKQAQRWIRSKVQKWQAMPQKGSSGLQVRLMRTGGAQISPRDRVLQLSGECGVGKTWLLRYLAESGCESAANAVYLDLGRRTDYDGPQGFVQAIEAKQEEQREDGHTILILDSVPAELDDHLRAMEEHVLKPHLAQQGAMVVMALIDPSRACWRAPALRAGAGYWLPAFELPQTRTQLRGLANAGQVRHRLDAPCAHHSSGGLPLLNYLLARWDAEKAYEHLLEHCLARIPASERAQVRGYLEAVCVLEALEHTSMDRALRQYHRYHPQTVGYPVHAGTVRGMLRINSLARAAPGMPGRFVLADSVRRAARGVLNARTPELYAAMNEAAHDTRRQL